jgi:hypothetical protein
MTTVMEAFLFGYMLGCNKLPGAQVTVPGSQQNIEKILPTRSSGTWPVLRGYKNRTVTNVRLEQNTHTSTRSWDRCDRSQLTTNISITKRASRPQEAATAQLNVTGDSLDIRCFKAKQKMVIRWLCFECCLSWRTKARERLRPASGATQFLLSNNTDSFAILHGSYTPFTVATKPYKDRQCWCTEKKTIHPLANLSKTV